MFYYIFDDVDLVYLLPVVFWTSLVTGQKVTFDCDVKINPYTMYLKSLILVEF